MALWLLRGLILIALVGLIEAEELFPCWDWTFRKSGKDSGADVTTGANGIAVNEADDVFIVGYTEGAFDGYTNQGSNDIYVMKILASGIWSWTYQTGTAERDLAMGIAVSEQGDIFITGSTQGSFGGFTAQGREDMYAMKIHADGSWAWTFQTGTVENDQANAIAVNQDAESFIAGYTSGSFPGFTNQGFQDIVVIKILANGSSAWTLQRGSTGRDDASGIAVNAAGEVLVVGSSSGSLGDQPSGLQQTEMQVVMKIQDDGVVAWTRQTATMSTSQYPRQFADASGVALNKAGDIFSTGRTSADVANNNQDAYVMKTLADGTLAWTLVTSSLETRNDLSNAIALNQGGDAFITGHTNGNFDGTVNYGQLDFFVVKVLADGTQSWTLQNGSMAIDVSQSIAVNSAGDILVAGVESDFGLVRPFVSKVLACCNVTCPTTMSGGSSSTSTSGPARLASSATRVAFPRAMLAASVQECIFMFAILLHLL